MSKWGIYTPSYEVDKEHTNDKDIDGKGMGNIPILWRKIT